MVRVKKGEEGRDHAIRKEREREREREMRQGPASWAAHSVGAALPPAGEPSGGNALTTNMGVW